MHYPQRAAALLVSLVLSGTLFGAAAQSTATAGGGTIPLEVQAGTPLRLYLTKRVSFRPGTKVAAKLADPVWAFDRKVIPAGAVVEGEVVESRPVDRMTRTMSIIRGDFTPLKHSYIRFETLEIQGQAPRALATLPSLGLNSIYDPARAHAGKEAEAGSSITKSDRAKSFVRQQVTAQTERGRSFLAAVRGPNKMEWVEGFLWAKLPYHPQWYRTGTRFDAVLKEPVPFGTVPEAVHLEHIGALPGSETAASVRFLSEISSRDANAGDLVEAVLSAPVFSASHQLLLPQGTLFHGKVTTARRARFFHRSGRVRFVFTQIDPPYLPLAAGEHRSERVQAQLTAAESGTTPVKVDDEGNVKAADSKTRFIRPVVAAFVASRAADNDADRHVGAGSATGNAAGNYGGRSLGGFSGFGVFGSFVSFGPRALGAGFGYYGLAWSLYSAVIARGNEVVFEKNRAMSIRFGAAR